MGQILLVRHAQASFGAADYDQLSELGFEQGRLLGQWLARSGRRIDRVVTGSLRRHQQTAAACLELLPTELQPTEVLSADPGFDEYDPDHIVTRYRPEFGEPDALSKHLASSESPRREFQRIFDAALRRWVGGECDAEYRETWPAFSGRCMDALRRVADAAGASRHVVVFTSGGPIAAICQQLLDLPDRRVPELNFSLVNCGVTGLLYRPGQISLSFLNSHAHLEHAGDARVITYR